MTPFRILSLWEAKQYLTTGKKKKDPIDEALEGF
jgi:hypothetical protein